MANETEQVVNVEKVKFDIADYLQKQKAALAGFGLLVKNVILNKAIQILGESLLLLLPPFFAFIIKNSGADVAVVEEVLNKTLDELKKQ